MNLPCLSAAPIKNAQTAEGVTLMCVYRDKMLIFVRYWMCRYRPCINHAHRSHNYEDNSSQMLLFLLHKKLLPRLALYVLTPPTSFINDIRFFQLEVVPLNSVFYPDRFRDAVHVGETVRRFLLLVTPEGFWMSQ